MLELLEVGFASKTHSGLWWFSNWSKMRVYPSLLLGIPCLNSLKWDSRQRHTLGFGDFLIGQKCGFILRFCLEYHAWTPWSSFSTFSLGWHVLQVLPDWFCLAKLIFDVFTWFTRCTCPPALVFTPWRLGHVVQVLQHWFSILDA